MTKAEMIDRVYEKIGLPRRIVADVVEATLDCMRDALANEGKLKIVRFGVFKEREKNARMGRNPKTGVAVEIPPHKTVLFRASPYLKEAVNKS